MEKYLICLDLDGTLLTDDKTIGDYTKTIVNTLKQYGHKIMITTGRPYRATMPYYKELKLNTPVVNFNGAFVHHPLDFEFKEKHETLNQEVLKDIVNHIDKYKIKNIVAEVRDDIYIHYHDSVLMEEFHMGKPNITTGNLKQKMRDEATTVLIKTDEYNLERLRTAFDQVYAETIAHRRWDRGTEVIEIVKKGISKAVGVQYVLDYLDIKKENIIAFGDEDNDLKMIEYVNHGVAMKNAIGDLKTVANDVTPYSNNYDGVGRYLNDYFGLDINYTGEDFYETRH